MSKGRVLLADNHTDYLDTCAEYLSDAGYSVWKSSDPGTAQRILTEDWVHLAVLDLRLEDDDDDKDKSGLIIAQAIAPSVPKIILTNFPTLHDVRRALKPSFDGSSSAIDFVEKDDGLDALLEAVEQAFLHHVRINQKLTIVFSEQNGITFLNLTKIIENVLMNEHLFDRAAELEDLFRGLFYEFDYIRIDRLLWQHKKRFAVSVFAFAEGKLPESMVVTCGERSSQIEERHRYKEFAPAVPGDVGTVLNRSHDATHFAANAYILAGADLENVQSLTERFHNSQEKILNSAIRTLFMNALAAWHGEKRLPAPSLMLNELYHLKLDSSLKRLTPETFDKRLHSLIEQMPALGLSIKLMADKLTINFDGQANTYSDPKPLLFGSNVFERPPFLLRTPGTLSGHNIFTDGNGTTWLTDFADAGMAPPLWNYAALESVIRFDWTAGVRLQWLHQMESYLIDGEFSKLYTSDVEQPLRKPLRTIQAIRRLVPRSACKDPTTFHVGILFEAASRFADFDPELRLMPGMMAQAAHLLIAIAIICDRLNRSKQRAADTSPMLAEAGLQIDEANRAVWVNGTRIMLGKQSYALLRDFYDHPNQLRSRRELVEEVFKEKFDETDISQASRLNTAIHRLRTQLEEDSTHPRYLLTVQGGGYRLILHPEQ